MRGLARGAVAIAVVLWALPGCAIDGPAQAPSARTDSSASAPALSSPPAALRSTDVAGTTVSIVEGRVATACFDFVAPDIGAAWELHPDAGNCVADVNWPEGDSLTMVVVRAQTGDSSAEGSHAAMVAAGVEPFAETPLVVDGQAAHAFDFVDSFGLVRRNVIVELPQDRFELEGEPLTGIFIAGYRDQGELGAVFDELVSSIDIH